ncbi:MAG: hypothetical protein PHY14_03740 [Candidatus Gracilibacteria bacterium]|nr:hypothetical protein [Candidatus Gracilibacteria bacterium]
MPRNSLFAAQENEEVTNEVTTGSGEDILEKSASGSITPQEDSHIITPEEEEQVKKDLNEYIIESYKIQGTKILKELDAQLQKSLPEESERKEAYKKILTSLELREKRLEKMKVSETKKAILKEFLEHMIYILEKKVESLQK